MTAEIGSMTRWLIFSNSAYHIYNLNHSYTACSFYILLSNEGLQTHKLDLEFNEARRPTYTCIYFTLCMYVWMYIVYKLPYLVIF